MLQDDSRRTVGEGVEGEVVLLYQQHAAALLRYACCQSGSQETAQEGLQEAFLRFFVERRYGRQILNPKVWLYEVLRNYIRERMRAQSVQREVAGASMEHLPDLSFD